MKNGKPKLIQYAALWTLHGQPSLQKEWSLDEKFREAKKAGFNAIGGSFFGMRGRDNVQLIPGLRKKYNLDFCFLWMAIQRPMRRSLK